MSYVNLCVVSASILPSVLCCVNQCHCQSHRLYHVSVNICVVLASMSPSISLNRSLTKSHTRMSHVTLCQCQSLCYVNITVCHSVSVSVIVKVTISVMSASISMLYQCPRHCNCVMLCQSVSLSVTIYVSVNLCYVSVHVTVCVSHCHCQSHHLCYANLHAASVSMSPSVLCHVVSVVRRWSGTLSRRRHRCWRTGCGSAIPSVECLVTIATEAASPTT